jgi:hypothetical protein
LHFLLYSTELIETITTTALGQMACPLHIEKDIGSLQISQGKEHKDHGT